MTESKQPCNNHGIKVAIMPEKKGIIYKHTEYEITTKVLFNHYYGVYWIFSILSNIYVINV